MPTKPIQVMIVDDSPTARRILADVVERGPDMEVSSSVSDPYEAVEHLKKGCSADVMILDVQMPRMNGVTFLKQLMKQRPLPVVMCSSFTESGSSLSLECLEHGAVGIIAKPRLATKRDVEELETLIHDTIRSAAMARLRSRSGDTLAPPREQSDEWSRLCPAKLTADEVLPPPRVSRSDPVTSAPRVIAIGASTGGTDALRTLLEQMPPDCPGIVLALHMPERFTASFAQRLDELCEISVREAKDGDEVKPGVALVAPGNRHLVLKRFLDRYSVAVVEGPLVSRHRPSVDVLFRSVAATAGSRATGVILTGMGDDGATGMLEMKRAGAYNIAQDRDTCVVFGMPNEAIKKGGVDAVLPLAGITPALLRRLAE